MHTVPGSLPRNYLLLGVSPDIPLSNVSEPQGCSVGWGGIGEKDRVESCQKPTAKTLEYWFLKRSDITLLTKVCIVKAMVFPVVMYGCESWTIKLTECWRTDAFKLWCWIARSNWSMLKEINPEYSLENWFWSSNILDTWFKQLTHWKRPWCWERLRAGGEGDDRVWNCWMASFSQWTWVWAKSGRWWKREVWCTAVHRVAKSQTQLNNNDNWFYKGRGHTAAFKICPRIINCEPMVTSDWNLHFAFWRVYVSKANFFLSFLVSWHVEYLFPN